MGRYRLPLLAAGMALALVVPAMAVPAMAQQSDDDRDRDQQGSRGEQREQMMHHMRGVERLFPIIARAFANGTFFRVRVGDNEIDMHCPASLPLQSCVAAGDALVKSLSGASGSNATQ